MSLSMHTSVQLVVVMIAICAYIVYLVLQRQHLKAPPQRVDDPFGLRWNKDLELQNEAAVALCKLIQYDGAGKWPPRVDHDNWPPALVPYKEIYLEMIPLLSSPSVSLDDTINNDIRKRFRTRMSNLLQQRINTQEVEDIMFAAELGGPGSLPRSSYNGFWNCVALCRHMYRYAVVYHIYIIKLIRSKMGNHTCGEGCSD
jgi:hypothetical protein